MAGRSGTTSRWLAALVACAAVACSGCGLRWETEPSPFPSADAATLDRDALAVAEASIVDAAQGETGTRASLAADAARAHLEVLGGVYVAFPAATPTPTASGAPSADAALSLAAAIAAARVTARDVAEHTDDENLAAIATSLDLDWAVRAAWELRQEDTETNDTETIDNEHVLPLPGGEVSVAGFAPDGDTLLSSDVLADLALRHDQARFAYETAAAQLFAQDREAALARAKVHEERSDAITALAAHDQRTPLYQLRDVNLLDPNERSRFLSEIELDLGARYATLAVQASAADRAWLLNGAFDAYVAAMDAGGFTAADLPTLPGLDAAS